MGLWWFLPNGYRNILDVWIALGNILLFKGRFLDFQSVISIYQNQAFDGTISHYYQGITLLPPKKHQGFLGCYTLMMMAGSAVESLVFVNAVTWLEIQESFLNSLICECIKSYMSLVSLLRLMLMMVAQALQCIGPQTNTLVIPYVVLYKVPKIRQVPTPRSL